MRFNSDLKKGKFTVSACHKCQIIIWPPSDFCSMCLGDTVWEAAPLEGVILEFSSKDGQYFCVAEMAGLFRIIGRITSGTAQIGKKVRIEACGIRDGLNFFDMHVLD